ncbi:tRNA 5-methoxyuridine(34)/uridine 5-oxyacetic acid(34) synthase CmoB [Agaribacter flavus]|uniref:tRNA U34 carboxymethyltransferase n=1 Tax=Agaribacter flavus TaxID=1902781 RepID=A0ABV7FSX1_9ALTE
MSINTWKNDFYRAILDTPLCKYLDSFAQCLNNWENKVQHAEQKRWHKQLAQLPNINPSNFSLGDTIKIGANDDLSDGEKIRLQKILQNFMPWRKGPFDLFGVNIDTEWRSDWKWQRVLPHISSLENKLVLDVGCGSGYHLFRMMSEKASQVIGVDPTSLFFYQFHCFKQYLPSLNLHYLPLGIEDLPETKSFDTVFSMGVLYHRLDPLLFLKQLKQQLVKDGQLVLETLVIDGDQNQVLVPGERYAQMRNVFFIPSAEAMLVWLAKVGFKDAELVDSNVTSLEEQRSTPWMTNHSLEDFLDPQDHSKTVEGYPAPKRATFVARN